MISYVAIYTSVTQSSHAYRVRPSKIVW